MDFENEFRTSQINGTIYIKTRQVLDSKLQYSLESGRGEIFLNRIPRSADKQTAKWIVELASKLGAVYVLRFKVNFSGNSRGFAYIQFIDESIYRKALKRLPAIFKAFHLPIIVCRSNNVRELYLWRVQFLSPLQVYKEILKISPFATMRVYEQFPRMYVYIVRYINNAEAAQAHYDIRSKIRIFGTHAFIGWVNRWNFMSELKYECKDCQQLDKDLKLPDPNKCNCFKI
ncbi:hypothetical protein KR018_012368 [Drosophila ironensis]|nr:hypothetical protein KR018_012368 [Drosophila ironensis]